MPKVPGLIPGRMQEKRGCPRARPPRLALAARSPPGSPALSFLPFQFKNPDTCRGVCSVSASSVRKAAEWISGLKRLMQKLGLGIFRRRSTKVFSFQKALENELKDQLKLKENCLKFSEYVCVYTHIHTYIHTHTEENKREKE